MIKPDCDVSEKEKVLGNCPLTFCHARGKKHVGWFIVKVRLWGRTCCGEKVTEKKKL